MFIDSARILIKAGDGGNGCVAFRREKHVPRGGPSGGDGGKGGNLFLQSSSHLNNLLPFQYKRFFHAERGEHGQGSNCHGRTGQDLTITIPVGSLVYLETSSTPLHDFCTEGDLFLLAPGGRGGRGNARFATPTQRAPYYAEKGGECEEFAIRIELKLLADVGLVGFPNAGKSTLISVISSAKPKIADYPFTTLVPHLGVVDCGGERSFVVADIPGLIVGAHQGKGLGDRFLRHVERTRLLAHLVDVSAEQESDPVELLEAIRHELEQYDRHMARKPQIVLAAKIDAMDSAEKLDRLKTWCRRKRIPFLAVSSVTGQGVKDFVRLATKKLFPPDGDDSHQGAGKSSGDNAQNQ